MSSNEIWDEHLIEKNVTYSIELNGRFFLIENVPAQVNIETGEQLFSPETVERLHQVVWEQYQPVRIVQTPVYEYTDLPVETE